MGARLLDYVGPLLRQERERAGLTQADVAKRARMSVASVSRMERNIGWPNTRHLDHLMDVYETTLGVQRLDVFEQACRDWRADGA